MKIMDSGNLSQLLVNNQMNNMELNVNLADSELLKVHILIRQQFYVWLQTFKTIQMIFQRKLFN